MHILLVKCNKRPIDIEGPAKGVTNTVLQDVRDGVREEVRHSL